jgi:hypothetical protein
MMRRYAGKWHRFVQPDPTDGSYDLTNPQSFNRYAYVQNDPSNLVDPTGMLPPTCNGVDVTDPATGQSTCIAPIYTGTTINVPADNMDTYRFVLNSIFGGVNGFFGGLSGSRNIEPQEPSQTPTTPTQDRLPFNTCDEFVNWFSALATDEVIRVGMQRSNVSFSAKAYGMALASIAYYGYERHIHNGFAGFKGALVNAGEGTEAGAQGAGVYGHILFSSGAQLIARAGFAEGAAAYQANRLKDWGQALFGSSQYQSERAGNIAGKAVGDQLWQYFGGKMSQGEFSNNLRGILCE